MHDLKCQILFSGKNKKRVISLSSAELAQRVVKLNNSRWHIKIFSYVTQKIGFGISVCMNRKTVFSDKNIYMPSADFARNATVFTTRTTTTCSFPLIGDNLHECQNLFSGENKKKYFNMPSAESFTHGRVLSIKMAS